MRRLARERQAFHPSRRLGAPGTKKARPRDRLIAGASWLEDPAMTDFRAKGTIMGLAGLTAVFGMGTGGTPPVSSPEIGRGVVRLSGRRWFRWSVTHRMLIRGGLWGIIDG